jgi:hypothetical protein
VKTKANLKAKARAKEKTSLRTQTIYQEMIHANPNEVETFYPETIYQEVIYTNPNSEVKTFYLETIYQEMIYANPDEVETFYLETKHNMSLYANIAGNITALSAGGQHQLYPQRGGENQQKSITREKFYEVNINKKLDANPDEF